MTDIAALVARNAERWKQAKITRGPEFASVARRLVSNKSRYQTIETNTGVPLFVIAVIHEREAGGRWDANIAQGDPWNEVSIHVPRGRGPFKSFNQAAYDALVNCPPYAASNKDWSPGGTLTLLERYNGLEYANHNRPSPYIWAGTTAYDPPTGPGGKVLVDHGPIEDVYPSWHKLAGQRVVDQQLGCAGLILAMKQIDPSIAFAGEAATHAPPPPDIHPTAPPQQFNLAAAILQFIVNLFKKGN